MTGFPHDRIQELRLMLRESANFISENGKPELDSEIQKFLGMGFKPDVHLGMGDLMDESDQGQLMLIEWLIGQIISISQNHAYYAVNSWCNWVLSRFPV